MQLVRSPKEMQEACATLKRRGKTIGLVPTMGYLHEGHLSLVRIARKHADVVAVSIFVNPTQFGPKEDFARYPRDLRRDKILLDQEGCDLVFVPSMRSMYPEGYLTYVDVHEITSRLEGASRPGHFSGVTTVVAKLFNIVRPNVAVFGRKDAQQAVVLKRMVDDLNCGIRMMIAPTIREKDGLALSSRNEYLSPEERKQAVVLYRSLREARQLIRAGERNSARVIAHMRHTIRQQPLARPEYIAVTDARILKPLRRLEGEVLISLAVRFGRTRLIDNIQLRVK
jgi:pantoate--beta-alanine ligase